MLITWYIIKKTEGRSPKNFSSLFKNLRDDNVNPREALRRQIDFKLDLNKIKKEI